jgi:hypothetical protein
MRAKTTHSGIGSGCSGFRLEAEMAAPVIRWLRRGGLAVKEEFLLPWGVCDLVGVKLDAAKTKLRISNGQTRSIGSITRLLILSRIPESDSGKSITFQRLARDLSAHLSCDDLSEQIDTLVGGKFVIRPKRGFLQKVNGWAPLHSRIVAVELKLTRITDALIQATSNRAFATDSYVALPSRRALQLARSSKANLFRQRGIGLIAVSQHACRELIKPGRSNVRPNEIVQSHVTERFWRTRGNCP